MTNNQLRRCILVLGLLLTAAAGVPSAGAQGLSGADTTAVNNLLGTGVLGAALPASPIANPATLMPLSPGTWVFQFTGGPNKGTTETDSLQANTQLGADSQWQ